MSLGRRKDRAGKPGAYFITIPGTTPNGQSRPTISLGTHNKEVAQDLDYKIEKLRNRQQIGEPLSPELRRDVKRMTPKVRKRLIELGILEDRGGAFSKTLEEHVEEYLAECSDQSEVHVNNKRSQLRRFIEITGVRRLEDIQTSRVNQYLVQLKDEEGRSARTVNQHCTTLKTFLNWCVDQGRILQAPSGRFKRYDEASDRRHRRRAATQEELEKLLASVPEDRRVKYLTALFTGLRRNELAQLRVSDLDLESGTLLVRSEIAKIKGYGDVELPLHPQLWGELAEFTKDMPRSAPLFDSIPRAKTLNRDLERAGISKVDERGRVLDLHGFRTTMATRLLRAGVTSSYAKLITRHTRVDVLERHYNDLSSEDAREAVAKLPRVKLPGGAAQGAARQSPQAASDGVEQPMTPMLELAAGPVYNLLQAMYYSGVDVERLSPAPISLEAVRKALESMNLRAIGAVG